MRDHYPNVIIGGEPAGLNMALKFNKRKLPIVLGLIIDTAWVTTAHAVSSRPSFTEKRMKLVNLAGGGIVILIAIVLATAINS
ncbi:hypothetical protein [Xenorhabdus sp. SGI246]|uniref:hypothetical protein n=1 Tax=Xenorhabdus sp. SGI246 TaxID=3158263 RepID=UPI00349F837D